ncbi:MAG: hypothetical protein M3025_06560 [Actinomycetota bacterium]|nr:hypothetical protein [Actinomycetota bacterium]
MDHAATRAPGPAPASAARKWAMLTMEGYLLLAVVLLVVKGVQLAGG